ncbi:MAG: hypothetical protein ABSA80_04105 [Terriglobales bacterium]|jgi:hypothetical protein
MKSPIITVLERFSNSTTKLVERQKRRHPAAQALPGFMSVNGCTGMGQDGTCLIPP